MAKPNRALVRFFYGYERKHAVETALGWYIEIDFLPSSWTAVSRVLRGCTNVLIIKEIELDVNWFYANPSAAEATYDGTTLYISDTDYDTAYKRLCGIIQRNEHHVNPPPFPGGKRPQGDNDD